MATSEARRGAILEATIQVVGAKGYPATSVADVIAAAGVSRTTFYKHFDGRLECFLAAYDLAAERALGAIAAGCDRERPWLERVRGGLESLVELLAAEPELARVAVIEAATAGAPARARHWAAIARAAVLVEAGREHRDARLPANTGLMAVGAVAALLFDEIQAGRAGELPERVSELLFTLLVPYLGPREAAEQAGRAEDYPSVSR